MMSTDTVFNKKIDNLQGQLDTMRHEDEVFRAHANKHFGFVATEVATKEDLRDLESRMATKVDLNNLANIVAKMGETVASMGGTIASMDETLAGVAEKVGVSP